MECSICLENYNDNENKPYLINPCGHCMCLKCLNRLPQQVCPHCRGKIESRIINRDVQNIVLAFQTQSLNLVPSLPVLQEDSIQLNPRVQQSKE